MKYFLHLSYNGANFRGWQKQKKVLSVQEVLEKALSKVLGLEITTLGCGRTDAQVHASQYFAEFKTDKFLDNSFVFILNKILPNTIRAHNIFLVDDIRNVQVEAQKRTYRYYFHNTENAFLADFSSFYNIVSFDIEAVKAALTLLLGKHDFKSFCKTPDRHKHTLVNVYSAEIIHNKTHTHFCIEITANRFLKGMVRALVYALIQIGTGKSALENFEFRLKQANQVPNIQLAYPQGLYLA